MNYKSLFISFILLFVFAVNIGAKKDPEKYVYELEMVQSSNSSLSGFVIFKVWSYGPKKELLTKNVCMRNAVHGILFKGLVATDVGTQGTVPALCPEGYDSNSRYFDDFFVADYMQFVQITSKGAQQAGDVLKINSRQYKVGLLVQINIVALRKRLEKDGIIKSASSLFTK